MSKFEIAWDAPEFEYREKDVSWYWTSNVVAAACIAFSVWIRNFLFGIFLVIAEVLSIVWGNRAPRWVDFHFDDAGLTIDERKFYGIKELASWSDTELDDAWRELRFHFSSRLKPAIRILFPAERIEEFRTTLKGILPEVGYEPTLIDAIEKILHF